MKNGLRQDKTQDLKQPRVGAIGVGKFSVEFTAANYVDVELARQRNLAPKKVRRLTLSGVVDSGALWLVLPRAAVEQLGVRVTGTTNVRYANGQSATRDIVTGVQVELLGRSGVYSAIVEPRRRDALIGALVLEELDFLIDCRHRRLVPRDPNAIISEIE